MSPLNSTAWSRPSSTGVRLPSWYISILVLLLGATAQGQTGDPTPPPCPVFECLCGDDCPFGSGTEEPNCICGEGVWRAIPLRSEVYPETEFTRTSTFTKNFVSWTTQKGACATIGSAHADASLTGHSTFWSAGSQTCSQDARFSGGCKEVWSGSNPPRPRTVQLVATGRGGASIGVSVAARQGCSGEANATVSGSAASRGNAQASIDNLHLAGTAGYSQGSNTVRLEGDFGATVVLDNPTISGSISSERTWETKGIGSATGTLSFTVRPEQQYCAFTNFPYTAHWGGAVRVIAVGSCDQNGSTAEQATASISLRIQ